MLNFLDSLLEDEWFKTALFYSSTPLFHIYIKMKIMKKVIKFMIHWQGITLKLQLNVLLQDCGLEYLMLVGDMEIEIYILIH